MHKIEEFYNQYTSPCTALISKLYFTKTTESLFTCSFFFITTHAVVSLSSWRENIINLQLSLFVFFEV